MRGYRDDLETARQRIRQLEDELAQLPPKPRPIGACVAAVLCAAIALTTVLVSLGVLRYRQRQLDVLQVPVLPAPTPHPVDVANQQLQLFWPAAKEPVHADVDGNGTSDLVVLLWDSTHPEAALRVAALDGATFAPLWSAGPWPASWPSYPVTLTHVGRFVVVTDSQGGVHPLELSSGRPIADFTVETPSTMFSTCSSASPPRITVKAGTNDKPHTFDLEARTETSESVRTCDVRVGDVPVCGSPNGYPCLAKETAHPSPRVELGHTIEDRDVVITFGLATGNTKRESTERPPPYFVTQARAGRKILAEGTASHPEDKVYIGGDRTAYADGKVFAVYAALGGAIRFVAHDARTGALLFAQTIGRSEGGDVLRGLDLIGGRAFVRMDHGILVLDATTGATLRTLNTVVASKPVSE
jgi:hypothetical protein